MHGSVLTLISSALVSASPSVSAVGAAAADASVQGGAGGAPAVLLGGEGRTRGESLGGVKRAPKRRASTRRRKRVGALSPLLRTVRKRPSLVVSLTVIRVFVAVPARRKMAGAPSWKKTTVLRPLPGRKFLPTIVSVSPIVSLSGLTDLITGSGVVTAGTF